MSKANPDNHLIISCAIIGAEVSEANYPLIPKNVEELVLSAVAAVEAGASIIHLHVRDDNNHPTQSIERFREVTKKIKDRCDCIVQYSTGGAAGTAVELRCAPLSLRPEMATLSLGTMNFGDGIFENSESTIKAIAKAIIENNVMAELEIFDFGMLDSAWRYLAKGVIPSKFHMDFVLGVPGGMSGTISNLVNLVNNISPEQSWSVAGIGRFQLPLTMHAIAMNGHVRVGIEDNVYYRKGEFAKSNAQFVQRVVRLGKEANRPIADVATTRKILGLPAL